MTDAAGNTTSNATYTFLYDTTAPAFSSGASNILGTQLTWTLTETGSGLDTSSTTPGTAFTVLVNGSADPVTTVSTPDSTHVVLTLQNRVYGNDTVTVAYSSAALTAELYPDAREVFLVRDFRDMVASIFAFNRKRGVRGFGALSP